MESRFPRKSGTSTSTLARRGIFGGWLEWSRQKEHAPPSGRSSRVTDVITACFRFMIETASATSSASSGLTGAVAPVLHSAEPAVPRADVAKDKERCSPSSPAFAQVGAQGLGADGMEPLFSYQGSYFLVVFAGRNSGADPGRFGEPPAIRWIDRLSFHGGHREVPLGTGPVDGLQGEAKK